MEVSNVVEKSISTFWYLHSIGQTILWSLFILIGYISARFLKHWEYWIYLHFLGGSIPALYSISFITPIILKSK